jgi:hypothetical protein
MALHHVGQAEIAAFAEERVNMRRDDATELRAQANRLRERLESYLADHPDFELRKLLLSGSLAKGTALRSTSDADVACYVSCDGAPSNLSSLIDWLAQRLEKAFPNFKPSQIKRKTYSVGVTFVGTGNEVDIVPILYDDDPAWKGDLISQDTGERLMTSVPMHLDFIRKRKAASPAHFAQMVRLIKYWAELQKESQDGFRFKSFMAELILARQADGGAAMDDYPEAMRRFFNFIAVDEFRTAIVFDDYYDKSTCAQSAAAIRIWDPVNCENNVAKLYTSQQRDQIVEAACDAGDAIAAALRASTKGEAVRYWRKVFGTTFNGS